MKQKIGLSYSGGAEYYYDRNSVQRGLFFQLIFCFFGKDLIQRNRGDFIG